MLPLEGTKVLDLTTLSGYCGMELADYGAEVIKVEPPEGDPLRKLEPMKNGASEIGRASCRERVLIQV